MSELPPFSWPVGLAYVALFAGTAFALLMAQREKGEEPAMAKEEEQLSLLDAIEAKNTILEEVADRNVEWLTLALTAMRQIPDGTVGIAEDFRFRLTSNGLQPPRHHNAWGAFFSGMIKRRELVWTGEEQPMRGKKAHGRRTKVYVKRMGATA